MPPATMLAAIISWEQVQAAKIPYSGFSTLSMRRSARAKRPAATTSGSRVQ